MSSSKKRKSLDDEALRFITDRIGADLDQVDVRPDLGILVREVVVAITGDCAGEVPGESSSGARLAGVGYPAKSSGELLYHPVLGRLEALLPFEEVRNAVDLETPEILQPLQHRGRDVGSLLQQVL